MEIKYYNPIPLFTHEHQTNDERKFDTREAVNERNDTNKNNAFKLYIGAYYKSQYYHTFQYLV